MKKMIIFTLLVFAVIFKIEAQTIIVYGNDTTQQETVLRSIEEKNIVTWNWSMIGRGSLVFEYERKLNDYFTVMAGAGVSFIDFWGALPIFSDDDDSDFSSNSHGIKPGWVVEFSPRFFPKQLNGLDGFYIAPLFRSRNYNFKSGNISGKTCNDAAFILGWQVEGGFFDTFNSFYFGAGCTWTKEKNNIQTNNFTRPLIVVGATIGFSI